MAPSTSAADTKRGNSALQSLVFTASVSVHPIVQPGSLVLQTANFGAATVTNPSTRGPSPTQSFSDFIVSRNADVSTPALFAALAAGSSWDNVLYTQRDITIAVTGVGGPVDRLKLNLGVVGLDALQIAYTSGDTPTAIETAHYKFGELSSTALDAKGGQTSTSSFSTLTHSKSLRGVTTTALMSSVNPSMFGQPVTFTATVSGNSPTGTVTFRDGETVLNVATLSSGVATFTIATMDAGVHHITATYNGDLSNKASATTPVIWPVHPATTTVKLLPRLLQQPRPLRPRHRRQTRQRPPHRLRQVLRQRHLRRPRPRQPQWPGQTIPQLPRPRLHQGLLHQQKLRPQPLMTF